MYLVESKGGAIACMLLALSFLGTWPALLTLLERRGRLPQHTYLDYTITNLLAAIIIAFTFGEIGNQKPNFLDQLSQDNWPSVLFAMAGGIVLSLGNLATQYAWAFVGLSVTEVISSSITVVIDGKINKAEILFPGVGCFLIAVCFGSAVHSSNAADNKAKLAAAIDKNAHTSIGSLKDLENGGNKAKYGTADFLIDLENKRAIKVCLVLSLIKKKQDLNMVVVVQVLGKGTFIEVGPFLCGLGNGLQFMGGQAAGYAAAEAVQALPLVSTFCLFGEYRRSARRTYVLLVGILSMFVVAVAVLMASAGHRK
ncbi:hypothetical protein SASPL_144238 [Salvia splendens]|uniref:Uncharacterized protein n=1 Tax=Salvia splendens TaxID=180675 RepID=A0A8X8WMS1_SALSN|nr:hypothetical protein SASPL_144238 [Salvia splendens]